MHHSLHAVRAGLACALAAHAPSALAGGAPTCLEDDKFTAAGVFSNDIFGFAIAMDDGLAAVSAIWDDDNGFDAGAVYVFRLEDDAWVQEAKLTAFDGGAGDSFGRSVALDAGTLVVGAHAHDANGTDAGAAYVFVRQAPGVWTSQGKLLASDGGPADRLGWSCGVSGDHAILSAHRDDDNGIDAGAAYIFERDGVHWVETAKLTASDGAAGDQFGLAVAIDAGGAVVGAFEDVTPQGNTGSAYVFARTESDGWTPLQKLLPTNAGSGDAFGRAVAMDAGRAVIGSPFFGPLNHGRAYVYERGGDGLWTLGDQLVSSTPKTQAWLGRSVDLRGGLAVIGGAGSGSGPEEAAAFGLVDGSWAHLATLDSSDATALDLFGSPAATDGERVLIGAQWDDDHGVNSGSVYVYDGACFLPPPACTGDLDGDLEVTAADLNALLATFGLEVTPGSFGDVDGDGLVGSADLNALLAAFGAVCD